MFKVTLLKGIREGGSCADPEGRIGHVLDLFKLARSGLEINFISW